MGKGSVLFVTTLNLATNPRLVKELRLSLKLGLKPTVMCFVFNHWTSRMNEELIREFGTRVRFVLLSADRKPFGPWLLSSLGEEIAKLFWQACKVRSFLGIVDKRTILILNAFRRIRKQEYDFIVGHNPGVIYPIWLLSRSKNIPFGFDLEDYHPGETNSKSTSYRYQMILKRFLPDAAYVSAASPLILEYASKDYTLNQGKQLVVYNAFEKSDFTAPQPRQNVKLNMVWFSQHIDAGRGLEAFSDVLIELEDLIELHLYGNDQTAFCQEYKQKHKNVFVHGPLRQKELHMMLNTYDVGLAIEPAKDLNNCLAVSNKIIAYLQAGLYIVASDTKAQKKIMTEFCENGIVIDLKNSKMVRDTLNELALNKDMIRNGTIQRFRISEGFNWESESKKLASIWKPLYE